MDRRMIHIDAALPQGGTYVGPNRNCPNLWPGGTNVTLAQTAEISRKGALMLTLAKTSQIGCLGSMAMFQGSWTF